MPLRSGNDLPPPPDIDTAECENEPIRYPGAIQPHGVLLALDKLTHEIIAASDNCADLLGLLPHQLLGKSVAQIPNLASLQNLDIRDQRLEGPKLITLKDKSFFASAVENETGQIIVDCELQDQVIEKPIAFAFRMRAKLSDIFKLDNVAEVAASTASLIREVSGFERVMVYRFDRHWNGEVIGEARDETLEPYLGLCFPASDIPKQARELFKSKSPRQIVDALSTPIALIAADDAKTIDLGCSDLRSVSPIHIRYLLNMKVRATLTCSLVVNGELWGLVACHHKSDAKYLSPKARAVLDWVCEDVGVHIRGVLSEVSRQRTITLGSQRHAVMNIIRERGLRRLVKDSDCEPLLRVVNADGFALRSGDVIETCGLTPSLQSISAIEGYVKKYHSHAAVFASSNLPKDLQDNYLDDGLPGALVIRAPSARDITLMWFRRERRYRISWGGDPAHPHHKGPDGELTPRASFNQFIQEIDGTSQEWLPEELASADDLSALIEIQASQELNALAETILNSSPDNTAIINTEGKIIATNRAWNEFAEKNGAEEPHHFVGKSYKEFCRISMNEPGSETALAAWQGIDAVLKKETPYYFLDYPCHSPKKRRWFEMRVYPLIWPKDGAVVAHQDITFQKEIENRYRESEKWHRTLLGAVPDLVWFKDTDGVYRMCNQAVCDFFELPENQIVGKTDADLFDPQTADRHVKQDREVAQGTPMMRAMEWVAAPGGKHLLVETNKTPMYDQEHKVIGVLGVARDFTEHKRIEEQLNWANASLNKLTSELRDLSLTDPLTQLQNRRAISEELEAEFLRIKRSNVAAAILMIDIDHFKTINDTHGHQAGDAALAELARIFKLQKRATDTFGRYGGEEFIALLHATNLAGGIDYAERLRKSISTINVRTSDASFQFTVSIGVSVFAEGDKVWTEAVARADQGMYQAKNLGRNRVVAVDPTTTTSCAEFDA